MPVMSRPTMRACMVSMPSKVWMASARLHRFADIRNTRNRRPNTLFGGGWPIDYIAGLARSGGGGLA